MSKLFIFTAENKPARAHLKDSIESLLAQSDPVRRSIKQQ